MNATTAIEARLDRMEANLNALYTSLLAMWIFFMTAGFTFLETGSAASKNVQNIIMKNLLDASFALVVYFAVGYAFAFGSASPSNAVIGFEHFFGVGKDMNAFLLHFLFSINTVTIFGGSVQGRTRFLAYIFVSIAVAALIYPLPARWVWAPQGWLARTGSNGVLDISGSGVVHVVGGCVGFAGAVVLGPRQNRFPQDGAAATEYPPHNMPLCALGTLCLWTGWFAFNAAGTHLLPHPSGAAAVRAIVNTLASSSAAGVGTFFFNRFLHDRYDLMMVLNAILAGLVGITAGCSVVESWAALLIGFLSPAVFLASDRVMRRFRIDDPLAAVSVHAASGCWGLIATGLFASKAHIADTFGRAEADVTAYGLLLGVRLTCRPARPPADSSSPHRALAPQGGWEQLGVQLLAVVVLVAWAVGTSFVVFLLLHRFGSLRVDTDTEMAGMDALKHGSPAYPGFNMSRC